MAPFNDFDIIVVGAGHAGCEAALAAARMGCRVMVCAINVDTAAAMPCSPSIGGTGKGQLVKEIDALGGAMARITDRTAISYRTLNTRKGPAVQSTRTQNDKFRYRQAMTHLLELQENLDLVQATAETLVVDGGRVAGIVDATGFYYRAPSVILATGTFLSGVIHIGHRSQKAGRAGEFASYGLAESLKSLGFRMGRMKTGTPPRLLKASIDFSRFERQDGDPDPRPFSLFTDEISQISLPTFMGHTNLATHALVGENLERSALYGGIVQGVSARYCPSLEDKVVRFQSQDRHRVILEPEGLETEEIYASGLGNSLPLEIQVELVRSVEGLEEARIVRPAYAIEYDFLDPVQLSPTLETKAVSGLFAAGQINGTSGYEEAAAQGLWAGVNAACKVQGRPPFVLDRSQAYMAVMVDDLTTRGVCEPYRMFTSRAEYRLILREDNADLRLLETAGEMGLVPADAVREMRERREAVRAELSRVEKTIVKPVPETNAYLAEKGAAALKEAAPLAQLIKRAELGYEAAQKLAPPPEALDPRVTRQVEIALKYEGYIQRQEKEIERFRESEKILIPGNFDYASVHGLSFELKEKLDRIRPRSLGQASRMEGMTPAALSAILVSLRVWRERGPVGKEKANGPG